MAYAASDVSDLFSLYETLRERITKRSPSAWESRVLAGSEKYADAFRDRELDVYADARGNKDLFTVAMRF